MNGDYVTDAEAGPETDGQEERFSEGCSVTCLRPLFWYVYWEPKKKENQLKCMQCQCNCPCYLLLVKIFFFFFLFSVHAAVIAINEAIEKGVAEQTIITLRNPNAVLTLVDENLAQEYQKELWAAKKGKEENAKLKVFN